MTATDDHADLREAWHSVVTALDGLPVRLVWDGVEYMDVREKAERARGLGAYLRAALEVGDKHLYGPAFALMRSGLEHMVMDWLVCSGRTYVRRFRAVSDAKWAEWQQDKAQGAEWTQHLRTMNRTKKGDVVLTFEGMFAAAEDGSDPRQISIYYFLLDQFRPGLGPANAQTDDGLADLAELRKWASENEAIWQVYLTWRALVSNLRENSLLDDAEAGRLQGHYRFLSGYSHPVADMHRALYGNQDILGWPKFDHFASELVLLYAIHIGTAELRHFLDALDPAQAAVEDAEALRSELDQAEATAGHFWFVGDNAHDFDFWNAKNRAAFSALRSEHSSTKSAPLSPEDVPFPSDPLRRLVKMHANAREMLSGLMYTSPWPHPEAHFRQ